MIAAHLADPHSPSRRIGGLEMTLELHYQAAIPSRRIGGLEKASERCAKRAGPSRRIGGLETSVNPFHGEK